MSYLNHLEEFECQRCLKCCTNRGYIYLSPEESNRIARQLNLSIESFVNDCCDLIEKPRLTLKTRPDGSCVLLKGKDCSVHPVKPSQCRNFPIHWRTQDALKYCSGLKKLYAIYKS